MIHVWFLINLLCNILIFHFLLMEISQCVSIYCCWLFYVNSGTFVLCQGQIRGKSGNCLGTQLTSLLSPSLSHCLGAPLSGCKLRAVMSSSLTFSGWVRFY